jgi:hypothetical protein
MGPESCSGPRSIGRPGLRHLAFDRQTLPGEREQALSHVSTIRSGKWELWVSARCLAALQDPVADGLSWRCAGRQARRQVVGR